MTLLAVMETPGLQNQKDHRNKLATMLRLMLEPTGRFATTVGPNAPAASPESQSIGTAALVRLYDLDRDPKTLRQAHGALVQTWAMIKQQDERASAVLPWLIYAELEANALGKPSPTYKLARTVCDKLWLKQISSENKDPLLRPGTFNQDTVGGLVLGATTRHR